MLLIISLPHLKKIFIFIYLAVPGLPWWLRWLRICLQCRRPGFNPWVGKIPWKRAWEPIPVFLPGESNGQRSLVGCSPWGHKVRHTWPTKHSTVLLSVGTEFVYSLPLNLPTATQSANSSHFTEKETKAGKT